MTNLAAQQDQNQVFGLMAHTGTSGTAETIRVVADSAGNLGVNVLTGEIVASLGTVNVLEAGTVTALAKGTISAGTIDVMKLGTVKLTEGSVVVTAGTIGDLDTVGTIGVMNAGTITSVQGGTVNNLASGSVVITAGTVVTNETEVTDFNGGTVAVGTAPVELTFTGTTQSIMVTADHANGTMVYLGGSVVAQSGSAAIVSLYPGESCTMDLNDGTASLWAVGGTSSQKIYKVALI